MSAEGTQNVIEFGTYCSSLGQASGKGQATEREVRRTHKPLYKKELKHIINPGKKVEIDSMT